MEGIALLVLLAGVLRPDLALAPQIIESGIAESGIVEAKPAAPSQSTTDCATLVPTIWSSAGYYGYDEPFEKTAAQAQEGDGCVVWDPGRKKRQ